MFQLSNFSIIYVALDRNILRTTKTTDTELGPNSGWGFRTEMVDVHSEDLSRSSSRVKDARLLALTGSCVQTIHFGVFFLSVSVGED